MNKKSFLRDTLIFILSAIIIIISIKCLGSNNLMVGITGLFLFIAILNKDFSRTPLRGIIKISFLMGLIAFVPYLANLNIYTGLVINFLAIFFILYIVVYTLNKTIYFPFVFGYTLFLTTDVSGKSLTLRIIGLIIVGIIAVIFQILYAKYALDKSEENKILTEMIEALVSSINDIKIGKSNLKSREKIKELSTYWSRDILEKRNNSFYLNEDENIELNLIATIERLDRLSQKIGVKFNGGEEKYEELLNHMEDLLNSLKHFINKKIDIKELNKSIDKMNLAYKNEKLNDIIVYEAIEVLTIIDKLTDALLVVNSKKYVGYKFGWKEIVETKNLLVSDFNRNSVRFIFAFRTALIVSLSYFAIEYFHIQLAKWVIFTITSVSQPYNDTIRNRAKGRLIGTLIGVVIYLPLASTFTTVDERLVIIGIAAYLMILFKDYSYSTAMLTVLFLGVVTIDVTNVITYVADRIIFVALGVVIVLFANRFIFPYSLKKETKALVLKYYNTGNEIIEKTMLLYKEKKVKDDIINLILEAQGFENKILLNNVALDNDLLREFRNNQRILLNNINTILNRVEYCEINLKEAMEHKLKNLNSMRDEIEKELEVNNVDTEYILNRYCSLASNTTEKLIYIDVYEMIVAEYKCSRIKDHLIATI
ncbi:FUSC family protein [Clostridium sp.]|uniref:FUSC family protein n=1 Tax=Clostridium sp. TaxID=1506 RepID=UPI00399203AF